MIHLTITTNCVLLTIRSSRSSMTLKTQKKIQHASSYNGGKPFGYQGKAMLSSHGQTATAGLSSSNHLHQQLYYHKNHHESYPSFVDVSSLLLGGGAGHRDADLSFTSYYHNRYMPRPVQKESPFSSNKPYTANALPGIASPLFFNDPLNDNYAKNRPLTTYLNLNNDERDPLQQQQQQKQLQQQQQQQLQQHASGNTGGSSGGQFTTEKYASQSQWGYQVLPTLYSIYQKVLVQRRVPATVRYRYLSTDKQI